MPILEMAKLVKMKSNREIFLLLTQSAQITSMMNPFPQIPVINSKSSMIIKTFSIALDIPGKVKFQLLLSLLIDCFSNDFLKMIELLRMLFFKVLFWSLLQARKISNPD